MLDSVTGAGDAPVTALECHEWEAEESMILILTDASDPHADHVAQKLRERGADFVRFDPAQFPSNAEVSISYSMAGDVRLKLSTENRQVDLNRLRSVWYRRPSASIPHREITDKLVRDYVEDE